MQLMFMIPLILSSVMMTLGQQADASCCRLDASIGGTNPTELEVKVVNLQETPVVVYRTIPEWDLRLRIVREDGQQPDLTEYAKQLLDRERAGSMLMRPLKQGESWAQTLDLRKLYILNKGTYTVTVSRDVFIDYEKRIELQTKTTMKVP